MALADDAFEAPSIRCAEDVYRLKVPDSRNSIHVRWKKSMGDVPIFRRSVRTKDGIATSPVKALNYSAFTSYL